MYTRPHSEYFTSAIIVGVYLILQSSANMVGVYLVQSVTNTGI